MKKVHVEFASCRVDLSGGTLDLWPLYLYMGGLELVNMAIQVRAQVKISYEKSSKPFHTITIISHDLKKQARYGSLAKLNYSLNQSSLQNPLRWINRLVAYELGKNSHSFGNWEIECQSVAPPGSGLGGSSVLGVAIARGLRKVLGTYKKQNPLQAAWNIQQSVRDLECIEIEHPAGEQDYVPALFGGLLIFKLGVLEKSVEKLPKKLSHKLARNMALIYTGKPHHSGLNNWSVFFFFYEGERKVRKELETIHSISAQVAKNLRAGKTSRIPDLVNQEWQARKRLSPAMDAKVLSQAWDFAKSKGAIARKACGAGGGGSMLLFFENEQQKTRALETTLPNPLWRWLSCDPYDF